MKVIFIKDLQDYLKSIQFIGLISLTVLLFTTNGLWFRDNCKQQLDLYNKHTTEVYRNPSTVHTTVYRQPATFLFITEGIEGKSPPGYILSPKGAIRSLPAGPRNYKLPDIPKPDWTFIVKVVFSLFAILLGYGAISGEKEQGTLRLTLANSLRRDRLLAAKYLAIVVTLMIPLLIGMLISLIITSLHMPQIFTLDILKKIPLVLLLSFFYLSFFVLVSLLFSSIIHKSSLVLLTLLTIWILSVVIIPNTSGILAEKFSKIPSEFQMAKQVGPMIQQKVWNRINSLWEKFDKGDIKTEEELRLQAEDVFEQGRDEFSKRVELYENAMKEQLKAVRNISRISPSALFQYTMETVSETGPDRDEDFVRDIRAYSAVYDKYILKKQGKLVAAGFFTFGSSRRLESGKYIEITTPRPEEFQGDKSDFPRFSESKNSINKNLRLALLDITFLVLWNLVLVLMVSAAFNRYDVR
ncbi:ABC transporter permease [Gemmatimonadota bacterium]